MVYLCIYKKSNFNELNFIKFSSFLMYYPCDLSQYEIIHEIGNSDCSSVYMARCILTNEIIALKMIDLDKCPISINSIETSIKLWSQLTCPNIIKYYGI